MLLSNRVRSKVVGELNSDSFRRFGLGEIGRKSVGCPYGGNFLFGFARILIGRLVEWNATVYREVWRGGWCLRFHADLLDKRIIGNAKKVVGRDIESCQG